MITTYEEVIDLLRDLRDAVNRHIQAEETIYNSHNVEDEFLALKADEAVDFIKAHNIDSVPENY